MMKEAGGSLREATAFSSIAEEFGLDIGHQDGLRNLCNQKNLDRTMKRTSSTTNRTN